MVLFKEDGACGLIFQAKFMHLVDGNYRKLMNINRRKFFEKSVLAGLAVNQCVSPIATAFPTANILLPSEVNDAFKISIFSKNLQWLGYAEMAKVAAEIGFDGIDLTVRPGGHVLPENVSTELPKAVEAIRKSGLDVYMITTAINDDRDRHTESILKAASALGIRHYRLGWLSYDSKQNIDENLKNFQSKLRAIAELNSKYGIIGEYQNHSGTYFGAPVWDLHKVLQEINSPWVGSQYDLLHATVEGFNAWTLGYELLKPYIKSIDIKDFQWSAKSGRWALEVVPLGEGLIDYPKFLSMIKRDGLKIPVSVHYEFPLGGAEDGARSITKSKDSVIAAMKKDCDKLRTLMRDAQLL